MACGRERDDVCYDPDGARAVFRLPVTIIVGIAVLVLAVYGVLS